MSEYVVIDRSVIVSGALLLVAFSVVGMVTLRSIVTSIEDRLAEIERSLLTIEGEVAHLVDEQEGLAHGGQGATDPDDRWYITKFDAITTAGPPPSSAAITVNDCDQVKR